MNAIVFVILSATGAAADDIDKLFEKAAAFEKDGDCTSASEVYTDITGLTATLPAGEKKRIDGMIKARNAKHKKCVEACAVSDKDKRMFETAKTAQQEGELKRVAEICKVLLHSKNAGCSQWAEIRSFCPTLGENGDPCGVSDETKNELEKLTKDVEALEKRAGRAAYAVKNDNPKGIDAVSSTNRELDAAYERLFDLRERYFACDKVYGGLKTHATTLGKSRSTLRVALGKAYKAKLDKLEQDLGELQKSKEEVDQKVDKLTQFTNDVALDVMSLAQTESIRSSVKIEGVAQSNAEHLAKVLQGDREAMEQMIKANPDHFDGQGRTALLRKKDALERLDQVLSKLSDQGYGERLGFKVAQQEVKATLALVNSAMPPEGSEASSLPWGLIGAGAAALALIFAFLFFLSRREKAPPKQSFSLSQRRPLGAAAKQEAPTASAAPSAPSAALLAARAEQKTTGKASKLEPVAEKADKKAGPRRGMLGLGGAARVGPTKKEVINTQTTSPKEPEVQPLPPPQPVAPVAMPTPMPMLIENTEPTEAPIMAAEVRRVAPPVSMPMPPPLATVTPAEKPAPANAEQKEAPRTVAPLKGQRAPMPRPAVKLLSRR